MKSLRRRPLRRRLLVLGSALAALGLVRVAQTFRPGPDPDRKFSGRAKFVMDQVTSEKPGTLAFKARLVIGAPAGIDETWKIHADLRSPDFGATVAQKELGVVHIPKGVGKKRFEFAGEFQMLPRGDYRIGILADDPVKTVVTIDGKVVPDTHASIGRIRSVR